MQELLETFGTVELDPEHTQTLTSDRAGKVGVLHVVAGQMVTKGESLVVIESVPAGSPEVGRARIDLEFARRNLERVRRMAKLKLATNQEIQAAEKELASGHAALAALGLDGAPLLTLNAPAAGVVAALLVAEGALVQAGQELLRLAPLDSIAVRVGFEVEEMPRLSEGLLVLIEPVFRGPDDETVSAHLSRLHRIADPATQLVEGLVRIDTPPPWAIAGTRARVQIVLQSVADAVRVPVRVLNSSVGSEAAVYVAEQGRARLRPVKPGVNGGDWVEIRSGLQAGEQVIDAGRGGLADGVAIRVAN